MVNYFWWFDYAVTNLGVNPLHNFYQFYDTGLDIIEGGIFPMFLFIPITHLLGNVTAYNLWVIFTFVFSGFGMYLLVDYLIGDKKLLLYQDLFLLFVHFILVLH